MVTISIFWRTATSKKATLKCEILELGFYNNLVQHRKCQKKFPKSLHPIEHYPLNINNGMKKLNDLGPTWLVWSTSHKPCGPNSSGLVSSSSSKFSYFVLVLPKKCPFPCQEYKGWVIMYKNVIFKKPTRIFRSKFIQLRTWIPSQTNLFR